MKIRNQILLVTCVLFSGMLLISSCGDKDDDMVVDEPMVWLFTPGPDNQTEVQETLITMADDDIIEFSEGTFEFTNTLSLDSKRGITIRGAGRDLTTLSFANQTAGAEGFQISNCDWFLIRDLTVADAVGDNIKVKDSDGVSFVNLGAVYTGAVSGDNGAYALYPVSCKNVYVDNCYVRGASDAGIYVGQSEKIVVRNNLVEENVAGIEIENSIEADVYNNEARNNTGGILIFDLPNLPVIVNGRQCRIFNNNIHDNSHENFALSGTVRDIPPGTGVMILASADVEVFDNQIIKNNVMGLGIISMVTLDLFDFAVPENEDYGVYDPYVHNIHIHGNTFERTDDYPDNPNDIGELLMNEFPDAADMPDIIYDGVIAPALMDDATEGICIQNNGDITFVDIDSKSLFVAKRFDMTPHDCEQPAIEKAIISAPDYVE